MTPARPLATLLWISVPGVLYLLVLRHFWFDTPIWDDYDAILNSILVLSDATSPRDWLFQFFNQHNEHRIAFARANALAMAAIFGKIDFRALVLIGNFAWLGVLVLAWAEFRKDLPAPFFAAAAFLLLQFSYFEAALLSMAAMSNLGVIFFAFACIYFATRERWPAAAACIAFGILAVGTQASGLFALPIAAAGCILTGKRKRATLLAVVALALWLLYFRDYIRPDWHPSPFLALTHPVETVALFLVNAGGVMPGRWVPITVGALVIAALAWLTWKRAWKSHPAAGLWAAFILTSLSAAAVSRVGFGVVHSSRYAIYSTCLIVIAFLVFASTTQPWPRRRVAIAIAAAALFSFGATLQSWNLATQYSTAARLLVKTAPSAEVSVPRYFGMLYPRLHWSERILLDVEKRGLWAARRESTFPTEVRWMQAVPPSALPAGTIDQVLVSGTRVSVVGWAHLHAMVEGRTLALVTRTEPSAVKLTFVSRPDVAASLGDPILLYSGFLVTADYGSEQEAKAAAASLCVVAHAPGHEMRVLTREGVKCVPGTAP